MTAPDPTALLALAGQVERLTDGDRSVDAAIEEAIGPLGEKPGAHLLSGAPSREAYLYAAAGYYTSAPSAALELVERICGDLRLGGMGDLDADMGPPFERHFVVSLFRRTRVPADVGSGTVDSMRDYATGVGRGPTLPGRFARAVTAAVLRAAAEPGDG